MGGMPWVQSQSGVSWYETCDDSTQPRPYVNDQPLTIVDRRALPHSVSGSTLGLFGQTAVYDRYCSANQMLYQYCPDPAPIVSSDYWMTKALANMNPNRPVVDLPLFVFELKDFPRMLKHLGDTYRKGLRGLRPVDVPEWHLAYSFGWAPLVSDLWSLVKLTRSIEERKAYLRSLEYGHRVRRRLTPKNNVTVRSVSPDSIGVYDGWNGYYHYVADLAYEETVDVWFTANAKLLTELPDVRREREYTYMHALGLSLSAETLWNALPWSWLIDYFLNIGDVLAANRGGIPWRCTRMNIMYKRVAKQYTTRARTADGLSFAHGSMTTTVKQRTVHTNPTPMVAVDPFLTGRQIAILGSLLTARSLRNLAR